MAQWNSWLNETWIVASYLRRLDVPLTFLTPADLKLLPAASIRMLLLSRLGMASQSTLELVDDWVRSGVHVLAVSGLPGVDREEGAWVKTIRDLFGIEPNATHFEALRAALLNSRLVLQGDPPASFGTWLMHSGTGRGATKSAEVVELLSSKEKIPFYFQMKHDAMRATYIPLALGYVFPDHGSYPAQLFVRELGTLFRDLGFDVSRSDPLRWNLDVDASQGRVLLARRAPLAQGGDAFFVEHWPAGEKGQLGPCGGDVASVHISTTDGTGWVRLISGEVLTAGSDGLAVPLHACEADILVPRERMADFARTPVPRPEPPTDAARRKAFPPRVYFEGRPDGCVLPRLKEGGYSPASLGVGHSADNTSWWTEPVRGYYTVPRVELQASLSSFGVLVFDEAPPPSAAEAAWIEGFLGDPSHRLVVFANAADPGWARFAPHPNALVAFGNCGDVTTQRVVDLIETP